MPLRYSVGRMCSAFIMLTLLVGGAGCTAMKTVKPQTDPSRPRFGSVKAGDSLVLQLRDGRRLEITVGRLEDEAVVSAAGVRYPHADIVHMQRRSFSGLDPRPGWRRVPGCRSRGCNCVITASLTVMPRSRR
jgi:hypothetical protein